MNTIICPACHAETLAGSKFCCMCGISIEKARAEAEREKAMKNGTIPLVSRTFITDNGEKTIEVYCHDITTFPEDIDILTISAFKNDYVPSFGTVIRALDQSRGITVKELSDNPELDIRINNRCWLSGKIASTTTANTFEDDFIPGGMVRRIGCVEMRSEESDCSENKNAVLDGIPTYFHMLDVAATAGIEISTVALPILGAGNQQINKEMVLIPLLNEAVAFLKRNSGAKRILFIEYSFENASLIADTITNSLQLMELSSQKNLPAKDQAPYVFISYSAAGDAKTAQMLCSVLTEKNINYWFAPEKIHSGTYAGQIVKAINKCTHFICLVSQDSMRSPHVLSEIDLAFQHKKDGIVLLPYRLDDRNNPLIDEFKYYLTSTQWHFVSPPPNEMQARKFIEDVFKKD